MFGLFSNPDEYDIDENREMFRGIEIVGHYHDRGRIKSFLRKYWDKSEIGWTIQNRLRLVDISNSKNAIPFPASAWAREGKIRICHDKDNDWLHWAMGHELGHLYGYTGTRSGEIAADDFADAHIYRRPRYRYSKATLKELADGPAMYSEDVFAA